MEWLRRHRLIIGELERLRREEGIATMGVLDFGGSSGALAKAIRLYGLSEHYKVHLVDIDRAALGQIAVRSPIAAKLEIQPRPPLPYEASSFDVVVSSDVFEHIPGDLRATWAHELTRVARLGQVHTMPCDSSDGRWNSSDVDRAFHTWYQAAFGNQERWTAEHIANRVPRIEDIIAAFHPTDVSGLANSTIWLESMRIQFAGGLLSRLRFVLGYLRRRHTDRQPPFKGCLLVVDRRPRADPERSTSASPPTSGTPGETESDLGASGPPQRNRRRPFRTTSSRRRPGHH